MTRSGVLSPAQQEIILAALAPFGPSVIYLFGSAATGRQRPDSDLDLAFLPAEPVKPLVRFNASQVLADRLGREVDLVDLSIATTVMAKEVIRTGILISENIPTLRHDFEMRTLSDYARLNEERQPVLAAFK
jgi:predicted nucleotidyltransferase